VQATHPPMHAFQCSSSFCSLLKPTLFHVHLATGTAFGHLFEAPFGCTTGRTRPITGQSRPGLGTLGKDVAAILRRDEEKESNKV